jgi:hypothetical protein
MKMSVSSKSPVLRWFFSLVLCPVALAAGGLEQTPEGSTAAPMEQTQAAALSASNAEMGSKLVSAPNCFQQLAADHTGSEESEGAVIEKTKETEAEALPMRMPFCLPGERLRCSLGPPPVCWCE